MGEMISSKMSTAKVKCLPRSQQSLQKVIGITFTNKRLLQQALIHPSYLNENPNFDLLSNERLEFLGDAVLGTVTAEYLYRKYPHYSEGELTTLRSALVCTETLSRIAARFSLGDYLYMGRGEESTGGRQRPTILAASFEAVLGAAFLDQGLSVVQSLLLPLLEKELNRILEQELIKDYKSRLQELAQAERGLTPTYQTIAAIGPDHDKTFTVQVLLNGAPLAQGQGKSKQEAEQNAARQALIAWKICT
ncbi:MAG: ribonuclease III [Chloroflexi bacterium]|nr:ribonuclease III [Chloroflexota bacterium]MCL5074269.1 ribonuclease III [Chloroflexota bacterium]